jgi:hypothetical protein
MYIAKNKFTKYDETEIVKIMNTGKLMWLYFLRRMQLQEP